MRLRWLFPFVPAVFVTLTPAVADAQPRPASVPDKRAMALEHAHQGLDAYREGRFEEAYGHFREAQALFPAPTLLVHMARCQRRLGKVVEAKALYEEVLAEPLPKDAPPPFVEAHHDAERELAEMEAKLAAEKKATERPAPAPSKGSIVPGVITLGVGAVGLGVGAVTGALSMAKVSDVRSRCPDDHCLSAYRAEADEARTLGHVSTAAFVVGGVAAAAGVVLLVLRPGGTTGASTGAVKDLRVSVGIGRADIQFHY
ncbi:tetratricopeptide repeat protein [Polyangium sp. y55x31]|uniref:tetratricopeptide repeat protein n=1 Tax=Polyangium sp. y55x31 TaxID=3042688 RepID=UPI0024828AFD|nr:tetratricopeptide repeat protein [Polyangium sp. y55x31]MDI1482682.1 tetratricopeptide repeat protein [Polyangium sp. y55x31]